MLKLEKAKRGKDVVITVRSKERFWNRTFIMAFSVAIALHLFGFGVFRIVPIKFRWEGQSHKPIGVLAEFPNEGGAMAMLDKEDLPHRFIRPPEISALAFPSLSRTHSLETIEFSPKYQENTTSFNGMEMSLLASMMEKSPVKQNPMLNIRFIGGLSLKKLVKGMESEWVPPASRSLKSNYRVIVEVKMEEQTGKIFWQNIQQSSGVAVIDREAGLILEKLQFEKAIQNTFVTSGIVELTFHLGGP